MMIALRRSNGILKRLRITMVPSTSAARPRLVAEPRSGAPKPPAMSVIARPIKVMMVPVTTGVISLRSLPMNGLSATSTKAAQKHTPKMVDNISSVPPPRLFTRNPALRITLRNEKLVPCKHSSPEPMGPKRLAWTKVPKPDTNNAMLMR
nr:hypothetical protein [Tanacetum cinerariifolium]